MEWVIDITSTQIKKTQNSCKTDNRFEEILFLQYLLSSPEASSLAATIML